VRRRANAHFGNNSRAQGLVAQMRRKHRDISAISRKITDGKTLDRRLKTAEAYFFRNFDRRGFDVRSETIPALYDRFVQTGDPRIAKWIIQHNIIDTVTPLALLHMVSVA
ncbi:MAG: ribonuclease H-like domain-containing protein, partial [Nanoarchaeota archaeon]|nr:ribonuclease H-like domain-containing protein [Nanoarchaeota archaeon]